MFAKRGAKKKETRLANCQREGLPSGSIAALLIAIALPAQGCWDDAATRFQVNSTLLYAIARTESGLNPTAVGRNTNGSRDVGLMQINSSWFAQLARYGIEESHLLDPCTNIHVGAWILAQNIARYGYSWEAVGAYNAVDPGRRKRYVEKVRRHLADLPTPQAASQTQAIAADGSVRGDFVSR